MSDFINNIIKNSVNQIKYRETIVNGEVTAVNSDGTYDVKIAQANSAYPNIESILYGEGFSVGEIVDIIFEYGCKEAPKIIGHSKKIAQEPLVVEVDYSGGQIMTVTIYGSIQDGILRNQESTYIPCHDGSEADWEPQVGSRFFDPYTIDVGQTFADIPTDIYDIQRIALIFDTSEIPIGANITSAIIYLYCWSSAEGTSWFEAPIGGKLLCSSDFDIVVQNGQPTYPHLPVVEADYNYILYSGDGGSINTADISEGSFNAITLNSTGRNWINKGGITKLLLRSQNDIDDIYPIVGIPETIAFISSDFTSPSGYIPKLTITYE